MLLSALAFLAGGCLLLPGADLPNPWPWVLAGSGLLCLWRYPLLRYGGCLLLGLGWTAWHAGALFDLTLPNELENRDLLVRGVVSTLPQQRLPGQARFGLNITGYRTADSWQSLKLPVRINWYRDAARLQPGERWQFRVRLKRPRGFANPDGFDYERWLFSRAFRATGYVKTSGANRRLAASDDLIGTLRQHLAGQLERLDLSPDITALLKALTIGDRSGLERHHWQILQATGTSHLLAISGLHVGLVSSLVFILVRRLGGYSGLARWWPAPRLAAVAAMAVALGYALIAGFELPARRALIMIWVWMLAILMNGRPQGGQVLGIALWLVLLTEPLAALSAGFWLSFVAVAIIIYLNHARQGQAGRAARALAIQSGLVLGLTPLLWLWFQQSSWIALPVNLVAIPWVGFLVVPGLLAAVALLPLAPGVADLLFRLAGGLLSPLWLGLEKVAGLPGLFQVSPPIGNNGLLLCSAALAVFLLPRAMRTVPPAVLLLVSIMWIQPERPAAGDLWLRLLDVGQGLSVVVETRSHVLVYDTGPAFPGGFDTGSAVVAPYLTGRGHRWIDRLVVSHGDNDHRGGVVSLLRAVPTRRIDAGDPGALPGYAARQCLAGQGWRWDDVRFEYLWPQQPGRGNNGSCVLRITTADGRSLLLAGDIEKPVETRLATDPSVTLASAVLVAPHHGSSTSSIAAFVDRVRPELVLFATGYLNRFGFPRDEVVSRYRQFGSRTMNSASAGAIEVRINRNRALDIRPWRQDRRRFWSR